MASTRIRKDFVNGVQKIFTTLFNNGSETDDGVYLYLLSNQREANVYGEKKFKTYQSPKLLVCKATMNPTFGDPPEVKEIECDAEFVVTLKSLQNNGLEVTQESIDEMRRGLMKFHDVIYTIDNIIPKAYVEDVFLMYRFLCTEDKNRSSVVIHVEEDVYDEASEITAEDTLEE